MSDEIYEKLANVLDTLPNGFSRTEDGLEIRLLKKIFTPEEAELFCDLRMNFENPEQVAERTGRPLDGLDEKLKSMWDRGQIFGVDFGTVRVYKMLPWVFGIYEFQVKRMDREFAEMAEEYNDRFAKDFFSGRPQLMQVLPVEVDIPAEHEALSYEKVSSIIENGQSFAVGECVCKKEQHLMDKGCDKPVEICMGIAPVPGVFDNSWWGRAVTREEMYELLNKAEEEALVHLTWNMQHGHFFICNCCGCCCGVLRSINRHGVMGAVHSNYYAEIDPDACTACGVCAEERCQVEAITEQGEVYWVNPDRCIGCGLCISTCPADAIALVRKPGDEQVVPPMDEKAWFDERAENRGVDYSQYK
ncbi:MAG: DUF362 domain-containing protein [Desulfatibacillaceae bacterium]